MGGNKRDQIRMTPEEVAAFLADNFKVQVATVDRDGAPHLVTMFYTLLDGKIAFTTYARSQKVVNLRRNPAMTCLVEDGLEYNELRGVKLKGTGRIIEDPKIRTMVGQVVGSRMAGLPVPELGEPIDPVVAEGIEKALAKRVVVVMEPEHITSWDHRKL
ncbi:MULTISPECIES: pyridoxamine 5'-phosphate oxidase family protein [Thermomonospora]|uniref:Pyridoxamine 5'-phosphate oxidase-related FMN-binding protein n=1 Tax=Thermomonospora curvata (strain ATCC 19995 / DSM 43183 / JCM 3096 / KCTC 9072 / NBRC 15933 / NCIMB 10081 / Henssen B9) TaxID=471852 RepID=D1A8G0_THECD|nr:MULTISPECIES: pyridoxamine 5'-phosphate oxidase family protein [Thermomonospora]ACY96655.1 pyridoxamine 5'-phosphate oxidase-related FMN- binding protein [Thermomonospora curvata DSM 43183]PKK15454.1 MAG: pyridoxamine 5'-phosphate oxidase [Thermomonospora sp. CIF 1]